MYDLTICSIFRDSTSYLERYADQVVEVLAHFPQSHLIWLEGDSQDGTPQALAALADRLAADVTLLTYDTGGPYWPSIDHSLRWQQLEACWNRNLRYLEPSALCICVESDLMWDWSTVARCLEGLASWDVVYPMLMKRGAGSEWFYDTNAFQRAGQHFSMHPPVIPDWEATSGERFVPVSTGGGLILTRYELLRQAQWRDNCVLHFPDGTRLAVDTQTRIYHP